MSGEPSGVQLDVAFRNFLFMRGQAVKDTRDVLTELITNAVDAYRKIDGYETMDKYIYIYIHLIKQTNNTYNLYLQVIDNATGVPPENMRNCFLSAGNKTASESSRGFFSTGAKNITIFGDVHYTSVMNSKLSKVYLDDMSYGYIVTHGLVDENDPTAVPDVVGVDISQTQRDVLGIGGNGMNATLIYTNIQEINKYSTLDQINTMLNSIGKIASLRDIFSDNTFKIYRDIRSYAPYIDILNTDAYTPKIIHTDFSTYDPSLPSDNYGGQFYKRITYEYIQGALVSDITFNVPNFPEYEARFVINKSIKTIAQPERENQMEFGFLIKDSTAIHEVTTLGENDKYRWNPNINFLFGYVYCDGFNTELNKYDRGETNTLIIDPNRVGGINHTHPLYVSILSVCGPRLELAIKNVQSDTLVKSININELDTIVHELEKMGVTIFDDNAVQFNFTPLDEGILALSIKETENHIVSEMSNETNLKLISNNNLIYEELQKKISDVGDSDNNIYYYDANGDLQSMPTDGPAKQLTGDQLQKLIDSIDSIDVTKPYIYKMDAGDWTRVEIYQKGKIDRLPENDNSDIKISHKSLTIQFINDINYSEKYIIDTTSGIAIKINLHNPIVADKLSKTKLDQFIDQEYSFKLADEASYDALNFLETLISSAFTDIIVNNDIESGKVLLDSNSVASGKYVLGYWNKMEALIEPKIHQMFSQFISQKKQIMMDGVNTSVTSAKLQLMELVQTGVANSENIEFGAEQLAVAIQNSVYTIMNI